MGISAYIFSGRFFSQQVKGLTSEDLATRNDMVLALPERIQVIPDGATAANRQNGAWGTSVSNKKIKFDSGDYSCKLQIIASK